MAVTTSTLSFTDSYGKARISPKALTLNWVVRLLIHAIIGLLILIINFSSTIKILINDNIHNSSIKDIILIPIDAIESALIFTIGSNPILFFERIISFIFIMLFGWLLLSVLVSIRHRQPQWFFLTTLGLCLGFFVLHIIAWLVAGLLIALDLSVIMFGWIKDVIGIIFKFTLDHRVIFLIITVMLIAYLIRKLIPDIWKACIVFIKKYWLKIFATIAATGIVILILPFLWTKVILPLWTIILGPIFGWLLWVISIIFGFIISILFLLILIAAIPFALAVLGSLLLAQIHAGWHAGKNTKYSLVAGFAIGSLLTLILLTSSSNPDLLSAINRAWANIFFDWETQFRSIVMPVEAFNFFLPEKVDNFSKNYLVDNQASIFDTVILLLVLTMAIISLTERLLSSQKCSPSMVKVRFILIEYLKIILGMFLAVMLIFFVGLAGGD